MRSRLWLVAESFFKLRDALKTWEISHTTRRCAVGSFRVRLLMFTLA